MRATQDTLPTGVASQIRWTPQTQTELAQSRFGIAPNATLGVEPKLTIVLLRQDLPKNGQYASVGRATIRKHRYRLPAHPDALIVLDPIK